MPKFVEAYVVKGGAKVTVPAHYLTSPAFKGIYRLTPAERAREAKAATTKPKRERPEPPARPRFDAEPLDTVEQATEPEPPAQGENQEGVTPDA